MSPEAQRIAIAEACGWTNIRLRPWMIGTIPNEDCEMAVPVYLNDLNAMREAFMSLSDADKMIFASELYMLCRSLHEDNDVAMLMATTGMWCEAFLKAIGKWEGGAE